MVHACKKKSRLFPDNLWISSSLWGDLPASTRKHLFELTNQNRLSVAAGDLKLLGGRWYITHSGLLRISERRRCNGIRTSVDRHLSDSSLSRWVFKAVVFKNPMSKGFVGYGDANPSNVSTLVRGAEMRVAETRAVNRALRKAYGIGLCSVEELGWTPRMAEPDHSDQNASGSIANNGNDTPHSQPRLRDQLCLLVRKHQLDSALVKSYAADFCGTETLKGASRELIEAFVNNLAEWAAKDRDGLVCKLNSYSRTEEVTQ
jgi:hypothetical protein